MDSPRNRPLWRNFGGLSWTNAWKQNSPVVGDLRVMKFEKLKYYPMHIWNRPWPFIYEHHNRVPMLLSVTFDKIATRCGRLSVAVSVCGRFGLWPFRSVAVSVCGRFGFGRFGLWPLWPESICGMASILSLGLNVLSYSYARCHNGRAPAMDMVCGGLPSFHDMCWKLSKCQFVAHSDYIKVIDTRTFLFFQGLVSYV